MLIVLHPKSVSSRRHERALKKELGFWSREGIIADQAFRTRRYLGPVLAEVESFGANRIEHVLDVGCGPSCVAQCIPCGKKWYLDPLLAEYRALLGGSMPPGEALATSIEDARLTPGLFDVVVCLNSIDHVRDPRLALARIYSAMKPGAILLLSVYVRGRVISFLRNLQERLHLATDPAHPFTFSRTSMEAQLTRAGFAIRSVLTIAEDRIRQEILWTCAKK